MTAAAITRDTTLRNEAIHSLESARLKASETAQSCHSMVARGWTASYPPPQLTDNGRRVVVVRTTALLSFRESGGFSIQCCFSVGYWLSLSASCQHPKPSSSFLRSHRKIYQITLSHNRCRYYTASSSSSSSSSSSPCCRLATRCRS